MGMQWPGLLWGLLLVPATLAAYLLAQRRRAHYAARFTNLDLLAKVAGSAGWRRHLPAALYLLALTTLLLALARPQAVALVPKERATVVLVMDVSGSMNAVDVQPMRLAAAQQSVVRFLGQLPAKFRVGLVSFSSTAQILTIPTTDRDAVRNALFSLRAEGATAMGDGIERALELKRPPAPPGTTTNTVPGVTPPSTAPANRGSDPMVILLLSDGANTQGRTQPLDAARHARQLNVPVYTIALGTDTGMVDIPDEQTGQLRRIPVPPDRFTLRRIAEATNARTFDAPSSKDLKTIYQDLGSKIGFVKQRQEVTVGFAAGALLLLVAGAGMALVWFGRFP